MKYFHKFINDFNFKRVKFEINAKEIYRRESSRLQVIAMSSVNDIALCFSSINASFLTFVSGFKSMIQYFSEQEELLEKQIDILLSDLSQETTRRSLNRKRVWVKDKNLGFWEKICVDMTGHDFRENFRVNRTTFKQILDLVGDKIKTQDTQLRKAIATDKKLAIALKVNL